MSRGRETNQHTVLRQHSLQQAQNLLRQDILMYICRFRRCRLLRGMDELLGDGTGLLDCANALIAIRARADLLRIVDHLLVDGLLSLRISGGVEELLDALLSLSRVQQHPGTRLADALDGLQGVPEKPDVEHRQGQVHSAKMPSAFLDLLPASAARLILLAGAHPPVQRPERMWPGALIQHIVVHLHHSTPANLVRPPSGELDPRHTMGVGELEVVDGPLVRQDSPIIVVIPMGR
mmetsp:Transcript_78269/g.209232  ORF Transcript_78269/g.209232 Transcript_78269/m.209232 type:complete len:235 (-) Transcript_78269:47-751(-)